MSQTSTNTAAMPRTARAGWLVASVGSCVGLSIMGDSLLYSILPLAAPALGISLPAVGVLLSVNRLVRLISNSSAGIVFERYGPRWPFIIAACIGFIATVGYGVAAGFIGLIVARLLWGIAWSALRQGGYQAVWAGRVEQKGRLTGLLWGLVRLGSAIAVVAGGFLFDRIGYGAAIGMATVSALLAIPVAMLVRWPQAETQEKESIKSDAPASKPRAQAERSAWRVALGAPVQRWLTIAGFLEYLVSGVVVSTTAIFVAERAGAGSEQAILFGIGIATLTGLLHGVRWITDLALGPLVGALSDRFGQAMTALLVAATLTVAVGLALVTPPLVSILCLFCVLICDGALHIVMSAAASGVALDTTRPHAFISLYATTTDAGSALGPLVAYSLVTQLGLGLVYSVLSFLLLAGVIQFWRSTRRSVFA